MTARAIVTTARDEILVRAYVAAWKVWARLSGRPT